MNLKDINLRDCEIQKGITVYSNNLPIHITEDKLINKSQKYVQPSFIIDILNSTPKEKPKVYRRSTAILKRRGYRLYTQFNQKNTRVIRYLISNIFVYDFAQGKIKSLKYLPKGVVLEVYFQNNKVKLCGKHCNNYFYDVNLERELEYQKNLTRRRKSQIWKVREKNFFIEKLNKNKSPSLLIKSFSKNSKKI